ncbi:MAG: hypothetical protein ABEL76_05240 [Bradymonadaceae bacterium]
MRHSAHKLAWPMVAASCLVLWGQPAAAADTGPGGGSETAQSISLDQSFDRPETIRVGTPLSVELVVRHPASAEATLRPELRESNWELLGSDRSTGETVTRFEVRYAVYRPGPATLPPQSVRVETKSGRTHELETDPVDVQVTSGLGDGKRTLARARPPHRPPAGTPSWLWYLAGPAALAAVGGVYWYRRTRTRGESTAESAPPPEVEARRALARLESPALETETDVLVFYVELSAVVRRYLGRTHGVPGVESAAGELLARLDADGALDDELRSTLVDWFRHVERVKFSGVTPGADRAERALEEARSLVEAVETRGATDGGNDDASASTNDRDDAPDRHSEESDPPEGESRWRPTDSSRTDEASTSADAPPEPSEEADRPEIEVDAPENDADRADEESPDAESDDGTVAQGRGEDS